MKSKLCILVAIFFFNSVTYGQAAGQFFGNRGGAEFWVGKEEGKPMIVVNLVNGVSSPGIYHVPVDTTIAQLVAYAGGAVKNAELDNIEIRRTKSRDQIEFLEVNLKRMLRNNTSMVTVNDKDIVNIPVSYDIERTAAYIGIIAGSAGIILAAIAIRDSK